MSTSSLHDHPAITYEAIPHTSDLLNALLLSQILNHTLNDWVDMLERMRILPITALRQPLHNIKVRRSVNLQCIAIEDIRYNCVVAIGSKLISHQLAVLPDADNIGKKEDCGVFVDVVSCGFGDVGFDVSQLDRFSSGISPVEWM
jgi:hypothetical protein